MSAAGSDHHGPNHSYHLVDPSPWPMYCAFAAFALVLALVFWMKNAFGVQAWPALPIAPGLFSLPSVLIGPFVILLFGMFMWWRDIVREGEHEGHHSPIVQIGLRYGMLLFIASEIMFFAAFFWAFFDYSMFPREGFGGVWPPTGIETLDALDLPLYNTLILLLSGTTVTWAHHALREGDRKNFKTALLITVLLGLLFTFAQVVEYYEAPWSLSDGVYPTTFYLATGFHGFHVIVGTIFLAVCYFRGLKGHFKPDHHFGFEAAAWYWHFVDVVWIFLYIAVYFSVFSNLAN